MRELDKILCIRETRTVRNDFTIAYNGKLYQIKDVVKAQKVVVEERIDGSLHITNKGLELRYREITTRSAKENPKTLIVFKEKKERTPLPDHPWKRSFKPNQRTKEQLLVAS